MTDQPGTGQPSGWAAPGGPGPAGPAQAPGWGTPPPGPPIQPSGWGTPPPPPPPGAGWGQPAWNAGPPPAPKPGTVPLRPLGFGEVLDGAFTSVQRYPRIMLGMSAAVVLVYALLAVLLTFVGFADVILSDNLDQVGAGRIVTFAVSMLVLLVVFMVATLAVTGMITIAASRGVLGQPTTVRETWHATKGRLARLIGLALLMSLIYLAVILVPAILIGVAAGVLFSLDQAAATAAGVILIIVLAAALIVGYVAIWVRTVLAPPALMLETRPVDPGYLGGAQRPIGVTDALRRSWRLTKGRFWRTFGLLFVSNLIANVVATIVQYAFMFLGLALTFLLVAGGADSEVLAGGATGVTVGIGYVGAIALTMAFLAAVNVLIYVDARMRSEGLDLELAGIASGDPAANSAQLWMAR